MSVLPTVRQIDSKFDDLPVEDFFSHANQLELEKQLDKREITKDILRGHYSVRFLHDKFPRYTVSALKQMIAEVYEEVAELEAVDLRMEMLGYLASSTDFQTTLYDMLAEAQKQPKMQVEIIKLLNQLKVERMKFLTEIGMTLEKTGDAPADLKGLINADHKHLEQRRDVPQGRLSAENVGRSGDIEGTVEEQ